MPLNLNVPAELRLAQKIARLIGETMTWIVTGDLGERLVRIERTGAQASLEELLVIAEQAAAQVKRPYLDHAELLYDESGLPK